MSIIETAITGSEADPGEDTPYAALVRFYRAFNTRDLALLQDNWLHSEAASMSNPLGGIKRGWAAIRPVYEKLFLGQARVYVEFHAYSIHTTEGMFVAVGRERGTLTLNNETIKLAIRTSRTYCRAGDRWQQLHHHGSMDEPALLAKYQTAVLGKPTGGDL